MNEKKLILLMLKTYKQYISPFLGSNCRFHPSCSHYAYEAVEHFGVFKGIKKSVSRLLKCHPLHSGGYDPVSQ